VASLWAIRAGERGSGQTRLHRIASAVRIPYWRRVAVRAAGGEAVHWPSGLPPGTDAAGASMRSPATLPRSLQSCRLRPMHLDGLFPWRGTRTNRGDLLGQPRGRARWVSVALWASKGDRAWCRPGIPAGLPLEIPWKYPWAYPEELVGHGRWDSPAEASASTRTRECKGEATRSCTAPTPRPDGLMAAEASWR